MSIRSLNHAVLYVSDVDRSVEFYTEVLGFVKLPVAFPGVAFLRGANSANDHDLGLFRASAARPVTGAVGLYHLAWEVETLADMVSVGERMSKANALTGASNHAATKALYGRDPDGIEFEVTWLVPDAQVADELVPGVPPTRPLDLEAEIAKYGANTPGGPRTDLSVYARLMTEG
ncbi:VOC family protein [Gordonia sp. (in: high G+C Gram-positive bacteria)]|uniref:VOC family protein n=1 Tax=Gordonia sp. (in: high G+C Gram-positive bacteria) TaxID=84139 RepID=UPI0016966EF7|nr:VOC family protein [Gordonia sp. (in: high G+C Gram-positive bacteria)]NLG48437.1 VOC family protein [Gordonia sp. (in: high G+C Gram-positive bacteria)]